MDEKKIAAIEQLKAGRTLSQVALEFDLNKGNLSAVWEGYRCGHAAKNDCTYAICFVWYLVGIASGCLILVVLKVLKLRGGF